MAIAPQRGRTGHVAPTGAHHCDLPQPGRTTKPGVAVATAHPRSTCPKNGLRTPTGFHRTRVVRTCRGEHMGHCGTPSGFGTTVHLLPGVRRGAATPGYVVKPVPGKSQPASRKEESPASHEDAGLSINLSKWYMIGRPGLTNLSPQADLQD